MNESLGVMALLERQMQVLQQCRPEFRRELPDLIRAHAAVAELMAVVETFLDLSLLDVELEERAIGALERARGGSIDD